MVCVCVCVRALCKIYGVYVLMYMLCFVRIIDRCCALLLRNCRGNTAVIEVIEEGHIPFNPSQTKYPKVWWR
jgi:hypothetical protein